MPMTCTHGGEKNEVPGTQHSKARMHRGRRREKAGKNTAEEALAGHTGDRQGCRTGRNLTEDGIRRSITARHQDRRKNTAIKNYPI